MSIGAYVIVAMVVALFFGAASNLDRGDYKRGISMALFAAMWPVAVGFGWGLMLASVCRTTARIVRKLIA